MPNNELLEAVIGRHGYTDFKWINPKAIIVSQWVRLKCQFGCPSYGRIASCPPNTPSVEECRRLFSEYSSCVVLHFQMVAPERDDRLKWSVKTNVALTNLERDVFLAGFPKAFLMFMDSCHICPECTAVRSDCKEPKLSRPSPEGMAIDVYATVREVGYPIEVHTNPSEQMNRYAILLVE